MAETFALAKLKKTGLIPDWGGGRTSPAIEAAKGGIFGEGKGGAGSTTPWDPSSDPDYRKIAGLLTAQSGEDKLAMEQAIARARAYYGTEADPLSVFGRLKENYGLRDVQVQNNLNSRGMWRSGETGFGLNQSRLTYLRDQLDTRMKLEDYINGLLAAYAKNERDRQLQLAQYAWEAAQNQANNGTAPGTSSGGPPPWYSPGVSKGANVGQPAYTQITQYSRGSQLQAPVRGQAPRPV